MLVPFAHGRMLYYAEAYEDAEAKLNKAYNVFCALSGSESEAVASVVTFQALICVEQNRLSEANNNLERARRIFKRKCLEKSRKQSFESIYSDPRMGNVLYAQGVLLLKQQNFARAGETLVQAIDCYNKTLPENHPLIGAAKIVLGECYSESEETTEAGACFTSGINILCDPDYPPHFAKLVKAARELLQQYAVDDKEVVLGLSLTGTPAKGQITCLGKKICECWVNVSRQRGICFSERDIKEIKLSHDPYDIVGQTYAMLDKWLSRMGSKATIASLIIALIESGKLGIAEEVFGVDLTEGMTKLGYSVDKEKLRAVARSVGSDWESLAMTSELNFRPASVAVIKKLDVSDQCYQVLERWTNNFEDSATALELIQALKKINRRQLAEEVFGIELVKLTGGSKSSGGDGEVSTPSAAQKFRSQKH